MWRIICTRVACAGIFPFSSSWRRPFRQHLFTWASPGRAPQSLPTPPGSAHVFRKLAVSAARSLPPGVEKLFDKGDVDVKFVRSSGPGGQNVNKVSTKADVRLSLGKVTWISEDVMDVVRREHANRINARDELVVQADQFRTQQQNLADALHRLNDIFVSAAESLVEKPPDPKKARRIKALENAAKERRIQEKKMKAMKKASRRVDL